MERTDLQIWRADDVARILALSETEKRLYQRILSVVPIGLAVVSPGGEIVAVNRTFRQLFRLLPDDPGRKPVGELLPSETFQKRLGEAFLGTAAPDPFVVERLARRFETRLFPLFPAEEPNSGKVLVMVRETADAAALDTAPAGERPPAAQPEPDSGSSPVTAPEVVPAPQPASPPAPVAASPLAPEPAGAALDAVPAVVWTARRDSRAFVSVTGDAAALFGAPNPAWLADPRFFTERIAGEDRPRVLAFYDRSFSQPGDYTAEFRSRSGRWVRETVRVTAGELTGIATDITTRRRLETQILEAQRLDAAMKLSGKLAHDLNNPLMIITGYGEELFSSLVQDHPMRHDIEEILGAAERMSRITARLTEFTRPTLPEAAEVELGAWLAGHGAALSPAEIEPLSAPVTVCAHPETLQNVLKALCAGRSGVRIGLEREELREELGGATLAAGAYIVIRLAEATPAGSIPGFDAVLADREAVQAYLAVRAWGGDIVRTPGVTRVYLRPGTEPAAEPEPASAAAAEPAEEAAAGRGTILLVEDEGGIRALVRKILKREGYRVLEAASGEEAVRIAFSHIGRIDLLLSDMTLPGMGGREVAERLRQTMPHLKALFISGFSEDRSVYESEPAAGTAFLQKPFTLGALLSKVRGVIEGA